MLAFAVIEKWPAKKILTRIQDENLLALSKGSLCPEVIDAGSLTVSYWSGLFIWSAEILQPKVDN